MMMEQLIEGNVEAPQAGDLLGTMAMMPRALGPFAPLEVLFIRAITDDDVLSVLGSAPLSSAPTLTTIRHAHHRIAMLLCEGKSPAAVSLVTGYSPAHINRLQIDPTFAELLDYYSAQVRETHVDTLERMKTLNLTVLDELSQRLEAEPENWTKKDLMDLAKLTTPLGANVGQNATSAANTPAPTGVALTIKFVTPEAPVFATEDAKVINSKRLAPEEQI